MKTLLKIEPERVTKVSERGRHVSRRSVVALAKGRDEKENKSGH